MANSPLLTMPLLNLNESKTMSLKIPPNWMLVSRGTVDANRWGFIDYKLGFSCRNITGRSWGDQNFHFIEMFSRKVIMAEVQSSIGDIQIKRDFDALEPETRDFVTNIGLIDWNLGGNRSSLQLDSNSPSNAVKYFRRLIGYYEKGKLPLIRDMDDNYDFGENTSRFWLRGVTGVKGNGGQVKIKAANLQYNRNALMNVLRDYGSGSSYVDHSSSLWSYQPGNPIIDASLIAQPYVLATDVDFYLTYPEEDYSLALRWKDVIMNDTTDCINFTKPWGKRLYNIFKETWGFDPRLSFISVYT